MSFLWPYCLIILFVRFQHILINQCIKYNSSINILAKLCLVWPDLMLYNISSDVSLRNRTRSK